MLARLIQEIPTVSTGLALVALFGVLIAWGYKKWLSHKERVIRGSQSGKQMEALGATLAWFKIDTTQLSSAQKYNLALAQIKAKQSQQRRLIALSLVSILLFTSLGMFAIVRVPEPT